jgi:hypothetical protein
MSVSACSSVTSLWVTSHRIDVNSVEQPLQLFDGDLDHGLLTMGPCKTVRFEPFQQEPEAVLIPEKQFGVRLNKRHKSPTGLSAYSGHPGGLDGVVPT